MIAAAHLIASGREPGNTGANSLLVMDRIISKLFNKITWFRKLPNFVELAYP